MIASAHIYSEIGSRSALMYHVCSDDSPIKSEFLLTFHRLKVYDDEFKPSLAVC